MGGQQVLEDTAPRRAEHRAKQVGYRPASCSSTGWGCGGFGHARGSIRRSGRPGAGLRGAGACRHGGHEAAPVAAASTDAGAEGTKNRQTWSWQSGRRQAATADGKTTRIIPDFTAGPFLALSGGCTRATYPEKPRHQTDVFFVWTPAHTRLLLGMHSAVPHTADSPAKRSGWRGLTYCPWPLRRAVERVRRPP